MGMFTEGLTSMGECLLNSFSAALRCRFQLLSAVLETPTGLFCAALLVRGAAMTRLT